MGTVNLGVLQNRVDSVLTQHKSSRYQKKKEKAHQIFEEFLQCVGSSVEDCTPNDICLFLAWKDLSGKTRIHDSSCKEVGERIQNCNCPKRLAWGTVSGLVSNLKTLFDKLGRRGQWSQVSRSGNPAVSETVHSFLDQIKVEQSKAHVMIKQAVPMFLSKLILISMYLDRQLEKTDLSLSSRFIYARDQAFFKLQFFATDRGADLGQMWAQEIRLLPNDMGLMIKHTWGKTQRLDKPKVFSIFRSETPMICPVQGLQNYVSIAKSMGFSLDTGFLFRPLSPKGEVLDQPLSGEAVYDRLKMYLKILNIDQGETPHSLRGGSAIALRETQNSQNLDGVMGHAGWKSESSAKLYTRSNQTDQALSLSRSMANVGSFKEIRNRDQKFIDFVSLQKPLL